MGNLVKAVAAAGLVAACALAQALARDTYLTEDQTKDLIGQVIQLAEENEANAAANRSSRGRLPFQQPRISLIRIQEANRLPSTPPAW